MNFKFVLRKGVKVLILHTLFGECAERGFQQTATRFYG